MLYLFQLYEQLTASPRPVCRTQTRPESQELKSHDQENEPQYLRSMQNTHTPLRQLTNLISALAILSCGHHTMRTILPILALCGLRLNGAFAADTADAIYHNGSILTIDDAHPKAEAVAVKGGRILAVGTKQEVFKSKGDATKIIDLTGKTMLPGFVDAHGHVFMGGLQALSANILAPPDGEVKDIASLVQTLKDWTTANRATEDKVQLIVGFGYDNAMLADHRGLSCRHRLHALRPYFAPPLRFRRNQAPLIRQPQLTVTPPRFLGGLGGWRQANEFHGTGRGSLSSKLNLDKPQIQSLLSRRVVVCCLLVFAQTASPVSNLQQKLQQPHMETGSGHEGA